VRTRYLVGADGAKSKVLDDAGSKVEGQLARAATVYVQFRADLSRYVAHRPSILYWIVTSNAAFGEIGMGLSSLSSDSGLHRWLWNDVGDRRLGLLDGLKSSHQ
jgi:2-polyprenyl-6-methoxyphenol hydroxylase-like FAD-dependent oxidoreductase